MSPHPPPPLPPLCLSYFTCNGKKKQLAKFNDKKSASHTSGSCSCTSCGSRSSLPTSQCQSNQGYSLHHSNSYSPTATLTDVQLRQDMIPPQTERGLTFTEDTESYKIFLNLYPSLIILAPRSLTAIPSKPGSDTDGCWAWAARTKIIRTLVEAHGPTTLNDPLLQAAAP